MFIWGYLDSQTHNTLAGELVVTVVAPAPAPAPARVRRQVAFASRCAFLRLGAT